MPDDLAKLRILLPHWIEHNEEHAASFQRWAARARELGWERTAFELRRWAYLLARLGMFALSYHSLAKLPTQD